MTGLYETWRLKLSELKKDSCRLYKKSKKWRDPSLSSSYNKAYCEGMLTLIRLRPEVLYLALKRSTVTKHKHVQLAIEFLELAAQYAIYTARASATALFTLATMISNRNSFIWTTLTVDLIDLQEPEYITIAKDLHGICKSALWDGQSDDIDCRSCARILSLHSLAGRGRWSHKTDLLDECNERIEAKNTRFAYDERERSWSELAVGKIRVSMSWLQNGMVLGFCVLSFQGSFS